MRGLRHYWRWHLGLFAGVAVVTAIIGGSLVTGDSVRATLARQAEVRLGRTAVAVASADGFFTEELADRVKVQLPHDLTTVTASPVLLVQGTVAAPGGTERANNVNIFGVRPEFWGLEQIPPETPVEAWTGTPATLESGQIAINAALARALKLSVPGAANGQAPEVIIRFEKPSLISRDAPLSGETDLTVTLRANVSEVRADEAMGAFSLKAEQDAPLNLYIPLRRLQEAAELPGKANLLLSTHPDAAALAEALRKEMTLADAGLDLKTAEGAQILSTGRIFLAPAVAEKARGVFPQAQGALTYLVNEIRGPGPVSTPYSMVTAAEAGSGGLPADWPEGTILINQWLAEDQGLKPGDSLTLKYFRVTRARGLEEAEATFPVHAVLPMDHPAVRREWTPDFPGISETENCRDWKPGIPIDQSLIRDKDDAYWREFKGTPKLFLPLADGRRLWENRFGNLTSLWIPDAGAPEETAAKIKAALTPADAGLVVVDVKDAAARAVSQSMDFGALFVSMSAFLILTALLLAVLLFVFGVEQRAAQIGLLRAAGWPAKQVRNLFLREALWISLPAVLPGLALGLLYTKWTLGRLESDWADAALGLKFLYDVRPGTLAIAGGAALALAMLSVWLVTRRVNAARPRALLGGEGFSGMKPETSPEAAAGWRRVLGKIRPPLGVATLAAAGLLVAGPRAPQHLTPMFFFGAAALLLIDGLRLLGWRLRRMEKAITAEGVPGLWQLGMRNAVRRRGRSMAIAGLLAAGIFMVVALNAFRQDARLLPSERGAGTGGFAFVGESTLPIYEDLNTRQGQDVWGLEPEETAGVAAVAFRAREGEEASCLNLNRAQTPRVLGVDPAALAERRAFPFTSFASGVKLEKDQSPWTLLTAEPDADGSVPAIMDQYSAMFALGKKAGDVVTAPDAAGNPVNLKLVALLGGTVLQGNVIIAEGAFTRLYPDTGGFKYFLVDAPADTAETWRKAATRQLASRGLSLTPAAEKLARFQAVQNTYLTIFSTLGGLALVLSTAGLGVLVARHVLERKAEFALLQALGFRDRQLRRMVLAEHWFLFVSAIALGTGAALLAVWPNLRLAGAGGVPVRLLAGLLLALLAGGLLFCWLAARLALSRRLTESLRHE